MHIVNYDSDIHAPYGVFKSRLFMFADPSSKYFQSPLQHGVLVWLNFHRDMVLLPRAGTYGFVARLEPSQELRVTKIDILFHHRLDSHSKNSHVSGFDSHSRLVYKVKNEEGILKTWDLNALLEIAEGHNYGKLKAKLSRILPQQKDYRLCLHGFKKWATKKVDGHWTVTMGETETSECVNDTVIEITSMGRQSHEQQNGKQLNCQNVIPYSGQYYRNLKCLLSDSTLRHYTYDVTSTNVPTFLKQIFTNLGDDLKGLFRSYYTYKIERNDNITKDSFKVDVTFPLAAHEVNVEVATTEQTYEFSGVPLKYWDWFKVAPESTTYSLGLIEKYENGEIDYCIIQNDRRYLNKQSVLEEVPNEWTLYLASDSEGHDHVYLKQIDHKIVRYKLLSVVLSFNTCFRRLNWLMVIIL